jgi:hypothetical protein
MGTDIHGFLERRIGPGYSWFRECEIDHSRNYRLFAALAGVETHKPIIPISEPRGLPDDHTVGWGEDTDGEFGDHSFSWLSLTEIAEWPGWDQTLHECGYIDRKQYEEEWLPVGGIPISGWSGGISGLDVIHADHDRDHFPAGWTHIRVSWERPLRDTCRLFLTWLEYAKAKVYDAEGRIVFGFDS